MDQRHINKIFIKGIRVKTKERKNIKSIIDRYFDEYIEIGDSWFLYWSKYTLYNHIIYIVRIYILKWNNDHIVLITIIVYNLLIWMKFIKQIRIIMEL